MKEKKNTHSCVKLAFDNIPLIVLQLSNTSLTFSLARAMEHADYSTCFNNRDNNEYVVKGRKRDECNKFVAFVLVFIFTLSMGHNRIIVSPYLNVT